MIVPAYMVQKRPNLVCSTNCQCTRLCRPPSLYPPTIYPVHQVNQVSTSSTEFLFSEVSEALPALHQKVARVQEIQQQLLHFVRFLPNYGVPNENDTLVVLSLATYQHLLFRCDVMEDHHLGLVKFLTQTLGYVSSEGVVCLAQDPACDLKETYVQLAHLQYMVKTVEETYAQLKGFLQTVLPTE
jgi:hypothetical protein